MYFQICPIQYHSSTFKFVSFKSYIFLIHEQSHLWHISAFINKGEIVKEETARYIITFIIIRKETAGKKEWRSTGGISVPMESSKNLKKKEM